MNIVLSHWMPFHLLLVPDFLLPGRIPGQRPAVVECFIFVSIRMQLRFAVVAREPGMPIL
jgi:hypothetical protein